MIRPIATRRMVASRRRMNASNAVRTMRFRPTPPGCRGPPAAATWFSIVSLTNPPHSLVISHPGRPGTRSRRRASAITSARSLVWDRTGPGPQLLGRGRPLEPGLGGQVWIDVVLGHEQQTGVGLRGRDEPAGQLVHPQGQHRQEALQIGLLVDGEVEVAGLD